MFFLNNKLYKLIKEVKSEDYITVFDYNEERLGRLSLSYTRRNLSKAYKINEVAELLRVPQKRLKFLIDRNIVSYPSGRSYNIKTKRPTTWYWSDEEVLELRDGLFEILPKDKNGDPINSKLISRAELKSKMVGETAYYIKSDDGELIRVWKAID